MIECERQSYCRSWISKHGSEMMGDEESKYIWITTDPSESTESTYEMVSRGLAILG